MTSKYPYRYQVRKSFRFYQMNQETKAALRRALQRRRRAEALSQATGEEDEELLQVLLRIGLDPETTNLLHLVPLLEVAWADAEIQDAEAVMLREVAALRGIVPGTRSYDILESWMQRRPADEVFDACNQVVLTMLDQLPDEEKERAHGDLAQRMQAVAEVAGGILNCFFTVEREEKEVIAKLLTEMGSHRAPAEGT